MWSVDLISSTLKLPLENKGASSIVEGRSETNR